MVFSIKSDLRRAWEIFYHLPKLDTSKVNNFSSIERNLIVSKKAREIFAKAAIFLSGMVGAALCFSATPLALGCGTLLLVSTAVACRFHFFLRDITSTHAYRTHIDFILKKLEAASIDWGNGVPYVLQRPVRVNPGADITENLNNLYWICERMPSIYTSPREGMPAAGVARAIPSHGSYNYDERVLERIKALIEKCWAFALRQEHPSHFIQASHLARWAQTGNTAFREEMVRDDKNLTLVTFTFGDVKLKLPHYMKALLCRYDYGANMHLRWGVDGVVVQNIQPKDFLLYIIDTFYPDDPNFSRAQVQTRDVIIREWFGNCFSRDIDGFNTLLALLKTLGNTPKEVYLKQILANVLAIPQGVVLNNQLIQDLNAVGVASIVCYAKINQEGWTSEEILSLARNVPTISSFILVKGQGNDENFLIALDAQLRAVRANLFVSIRE